jgi:acyl-CoA synthetase (NDP forming)
MLYQDRDEYTERPSSYTCCRNCETGGVEGGSGSGIGHVSETSAEVSEEALRVSRRVGIHTLEGADSGTDGYLDATLRDRSAAASTALDAFLHPHAIAVVGASSDPNTIAGLLFGNLLDSHFGGAVLPVNKKHPTVQGIAAYPDLAACPVVPDLVFVCVPASAVPGVVAQAGAVGVKAVCVISAGFAETGAAGALLEANLVREALAQGVRLVGPNCTGILSGAGDLRFNATFSRAVPSPGRISLLSQSGAIGLAVLEGAQVRGLGIGAFVSVGNSTDIAGNDLLLYWGQDPDTDLILLYLEEIPDPRWFTRIARWVGTRVPVVAVKAGRTKAGTRAAASHTAALSGGDVAVDAVLRQAGVIRAESIEEMLDLATMLSSQRRFRGRRVAILTNGGGPGILAADACETNGLVVPELDELTAAGLRSLLPPEASVGNPVDMIASSTAEQYGRAARALGTAPGIDALIVMFNTPLITRASDVAAELIAARAEISEDVPLISVFMNREGPPSILREAGIPSFAFPENAARALGRSIEWEERQGRPAGKVIRPDVDAGLVGRLVATAARRASDGWLAATDVHALLDAYGISVARSMLVQTANEAEAAQAALGCKVAVKVAASIHKSDVGGLRLGLTTPTAAGDAVQAIRADLESAGLGGVATEFLVQEQIESGQEMIVGVNHDPSFGSLVMVGLGGTLVEMLVDVAARIAPLTDGDIEDMLQSLKAYRLLTGYRGAPALDVAALRGMLHSVSALVDDLPEIAEMDLNPVFVLEKGAVAADVRIRLADLPFSAARSAAG